jgi:hypothetical protein
MTRCDVISEQAANHRKSKAQGPELEVPWLWLGGCGGTAAGSAGDGVVK